MRIKIEIECEHCSNERKNSKSLFIRHLGICTGMNKMFPQKTKVKKTRNQITEFDSYKLWLENKRRDKCLQTYKT